MPERPRGKRGDGKHKLRATQLNTTQRGLLGDGEGLYLKTTVTKAGTFSRSWVFVYHWQGRHREMGLGSYGSGTAPVSLSLAREKAQAARQLLAAGIDPISDRRKTRGSQTFGEVADDFFKAKKPGWSNANHIRQWERTLTVVCKPIRQKPIDQVNTEDVLSILRPIWLETPEVARRVRVRIEAVLTYAQSKELRTGENPARGRGHIFSLLAKQSDKTKHLDALPYADMPKFWKKLANVSGVGAAAVRFAILTAARPGEARQMPWSELDLQAKVWTVPAERMKEQREHRVPLTDAALAILESVRPETPDPSAFVFPGQRPGRPLSDMSLTAVLRRLEVKATVHGFRSTFRDWVAEETDIDGMVAEAALSHLVGDATERAYRRGDAFKKRRDLMDRWAAFCTGGTL
jgi:integrase